jgi:HPt (histidine-containing phosphotransfer) domain-containing protein
MANTDAVDLDQLNRYTGGDDALNAEILQLFDTQCADLLCQLEAAAGACDAKQWRDAAHALKGAARGIGAFLLGDAAAAAELATQHAIGFETAVAHIRTQSAAVERFIADFLARSR